MGSGLLAAPCTSRCKDVFLCLKNVHGYADGGVPAMMKQLAEDSGLHPTLLD